MFAILYSEIVEDVVTPLIEVLAGHVTLDEWASILRILKSRRPRPPRLAYCPRICRPFAWLSFLIHPGATPRPRRFEQVMLYTRTWQPGPFNATSLSAHLALRWPGEALKILAPLAESGFLSRKKSSGRVSFWLHQAPCGSPPDPLAAAAALSTALLSIQPLLETQQKL